MTTGNRQIVSCGAANGGVFDLWRTSRDKFGCKVLRLGGQKAAGNGRRKKSLLVADRAY